jgi:hypothetical protein
MLPAAFAAWPVQGDVEYEFAALDCGQPRDWVMLAQFDGDDART